MCGDAEVFALIVEDDLEIARSLKAILRLDFRLEAVIATDVATARALVEAGVRPRVFMIDIRLPGSDVDGMSLAEALRVRFPHTHIAFMTAHDDRELNHRALRLHAQYVLKPYGREQIALVVERALAVPQLEDKLRGAMDSLRIDYRISTRERQFLELKVEYYSHDLIAEKWDVRRCTVDSTSRSLLDKTRADSVPALAREVWQIARSDERPPRGGDKGERDETRRDETRRDETRRDESK